MPNPPDSDQTATWVALLSIAPILFVVSYYPNGLLTDAFSQTGTLLPHLLCCAGFAAGTALQWLQTSTRYQFLLVLPYFAVVLTTYELETVDETTHCSTLCAFHYAALVVYICLEIVVLRVFVRVALSVLAVPTAVLVFAVIARALDPDYEFVRDNLPGTFRTLGFVEVLFFVASRLLGASVVALAATAPIVAESPESSDDVADSPNALEPSAA